MSILSFIIPLLIQLHKLKKICFTSTIRSFFCSHSFVHKLAQAQRQKQLFYFSALADAIGKNKCAVLALAFSL